MLPESQFPVEVFSPALSFSDQQETNDYYDRIDADRNALIDLEIERLWIEEMQRRDALSAA